MTRAAAADPTRLHSWLRPLPFDGEAVRFDLAGHRSTVTRQLLQVRVRLTARAFGTGSELVAANVTAGGAALEVDAAALAGADDAVRTRLEAGPAASVVHLRGLGAARLAVDYRASVFGATLLRGALPARGRLVAYVEASATSQALGALKFCLPGTLRPRLSELLPDPALVDAVLAPDSPTLWSVVRARELALARVRLRGPADEYRRRLAEHRRACGYLLAEDVDFRATESTDAIDARLAALGADGPAALVAERRRLAAVLAGDRAAKARARRALALALQSGDDPDGVATLLAHVLVARALAAHEDQNRRAKMRLLRDLRDLADLAGLDLERAGLEDFAAVCPPAPPVGRPVPEMATAGGHGRPRQGAGGAR